jgi:subtilase family serine protease
MRVRYRWYNKNNELQRSARRTSRSCRMFVPLPNLRVGVVNGASGYTAKVTNTGHAAAANVGVQLRVDGGAPRTQSIANLDPGQSELVSFAGSPPCRKKYTFRVDPSGAIPETNEADNRATASCLG